MNNSELEKAKFLRALLDLHIKAIETADYADRYSGHRQLGEDLEDLVNKAARICGKFADGRYLNQEESQE